MSLLEGMSASRGRLVAAALRGAWRPEPPAQPPLAAAAVAAIAPLLLRSGTAALAWKRLGRTYGGGVAVLGPLRRAARRQALSAFLHEERLGELVRELRSAGIDPILGKGWAAARAYADPPLRPHGDADLYVTPEKAHLARAILSRPGSGALGADLHEGCPDLPERRWSELDARSETAAVGETPLRVFGPEDHLALIGFHFLRHGGWRPLWLCDLAAALEARPAGFDWDRCLGAGERSRWLAAALRLGAELLGAGLGDAPARVRGQRLPRWMIRSVLALWGDPRFEPQGRRVPIGEQLGDPRLLAAGLRARWPAPLEASLATGAPCNDLPRLPFQLQACLARSVRFAARSGLFRS